MIRVIWANELPPSAGGHYLVSFNNGKKWEVVCMRDVRTLANMYVVQWN